MASHHDVLVDTLDMVRGRSEWLIRTTLRDHDVDRLLVDLAETPPPGSPIEVGRWVHERVARRLTDEADAFSGRLDPSHRSVSVELAEDGLGFEVVMLVGSSDTRFPGDVEVACASLTEYADIDLFGPTPAYRYAAAAMSALALAER